MPLTAIAEFRFTAHSLLGRNFILAEKFQCALISN